MGGEREKEREAFSRQAADSGHSPTATAPRPQSHGRISTNQAEFNTLRRSPCAPPRGRTRGPARAHARGAQDTGGFFVALLRKRGAPCGAPCGAERDAEAGPPPSSPEAGPRESAGALCPLAPDGARARALRAHFGLAESFPLERLFARRGAPEAGPSETCASSNTTPEGANTLFYLAPAAAALVQRHAQGLGVVHAGARFSQRHTRHRAAGPAAGPPATGERLVQDAVPIVQHAV